MLGDTTACNRVCRTTHDLENEHEHEHIRCHQRKVHKRKKSNNDHDGQYPDNYNHVYGIPNQRRLGRRIRNSSCFSSSIPL
jgi:hypothetical protein